MNRLGRLGVYGPILGRLPLRVFSIGKYAFQKNLNRCLTSRPAVNNHRPSIVELAGPIYKYTLRLPASGPGLRRRVAGFKSCHWHPWALTPAVRVPRLQWKRALSWLERWQEHTSQGNFFGGSIFIDQAALKGARPNSPAGVKPATASARCNLNLNLNLKLQLAHWHL